MFCSGVPPLIGLMRAALTQCWLLGGTARKAETAACGAGDPSETCAAHVVAAQKKSQSVLHQSVARRLYKDRSLTMGRQNDGPPSRRAYLSHWRGLPLLPRGTGMGLRTGNGSLIRGSCEANDCPGFRSRRKRATSTACAQSRRHLLGKQSDGIEHAVDRDLAAHVRFHDDASQAKLIAQLPQPCKHHVRCTVGHPILQ